MLHSNEKIIKHKVGLLNLAEALGNVSRACKVMGLSRDTFYRYKSAAEEGGVEALFDRNRRQPNQKIDATKPQNMQTFVDTYSKVAFAKLYTTKVPITSDQWDL